MILTLPPAAVAEGINWSSLIAGFGLGVAGSLIGSLAQSWLGTVSRRRDHQFERMLRAVDEIRKDINEAVDLASSYWALEGADGSCNEMEGRIVSLQTRIVSNISLVRQLDKRRFECVDSVCELDFLDALTGGKFQVRERDVDTHSGERVRRFGQRLSQQIAKCSITPDAKRLF